MNIFMTNELPNIISEKRSQWRIESQTQLNNSIEKARQEWKLQEGQEIQIVEANCEKYWAGVISDK